MSDGAGGLTEEARAEFDWETPCLCQCQGRNKYGVAGQAALSIFRRMDREEAE
jgi:hypothetical protein